MQNHSTLVTCDFEWVTVAFYNAFWISTEVLFGCYMAVKTAAISAHVLCTPYNHDQDLLHAAVVKQGETDKKVRVSSESWLWSKNILLPELKHTNQS